MELDIYQVDAFTSRVFGENLAAVCPLEEWLPDRVMQNIAMENNLPETAFFVEENDRYLLRWFTPVTEVDLCGHATLQLSPRSGQLRCKVEGNRVILTGEARTYLKGIIEIPD